MHRNLFCYFCVYFILLTYYLSLFAIAEDLYLIFFFFLGGGSYASVLAYVCYVHISML